MPARTKPWQKRLLVKAINDQCFYHIEMSQLICSGNQLTGLYMMETLVVSGWNGIIFIPYVKEQTLLRTTFVGWFLRLTRAFTWFKVNWLIQSCHPSIIQ